MGQESIKKILILGSTGMLGHIVYLYLKENTNYQIFDIAYRSTLTDQTRTCDVSRFQNLETQLNEIKPDYIINCIGILIQGATSNPINAIKINALLPHQIKDWADKNQAKLIHISTDCVFNGTKGAYAETSPKDAQDIYGQSKALGEIYAPNHLTIRTSIIGPEIKTDGEGLLHWFFSQKDIVNGYTKALWSGVTTLTLAEAILYAIENNIHGLWNLTNGDPISKFDLLQLTKGTFKLKQIQLNPIEGKAVNKTLISNREIDFIVPTYNTMLENLFRFYQKHKNLYPYSL